MSNSYVPPHLRSKQSDAASDAPSTGIGKLSAGRRACNWDPRERSDDDLYTIQEICACFWGKETFYSDAHSATLHAAAENPDGLSWVVFNGANPKWGSDGIIFVKSNLNLLPEIH
jgi:hypothetical protein